MRMRFPRETLPVVVLHRGVSSLNQLSKRVFHKGAGRFYFAQEVRYCTTFTGRYIKSTLTRGLTSETFPTK